MRRLTALTFVLIIVFMLFCVPSFADDCGGVIDSAKLFTDAQIAEIEKAMDEYFAGTGNSVYIITDMQDYYNWASLKSAYPSLNSDAVVLLIIDNYSNNYTIFTNGNCTRKISDGEVNTILDDPNVYNNVKTTGDITAASLRFIELSAEACKAQVALAIIIGVCVGLGAAGITGAVIIYTYKKKLRSEKYPLGAYTKLDLTGSSDQFAGSFVTRRVINRNNGSRGGGGGGGGRRGGR